MTRLNKLQVRTLFRDACAKLRRCRADAAPATVTAKSADALRFDVPPLRRRPNHEKRALAYLIVSDLHDAGVFVHPAELSVDWFKDNADKPLDEAVDIVLDEQEPIQ